METFPSGTVANTKSKESRQCVSSQLKLCLDVDGALLVTYL